jgi:hypothetical protein
LAGAGGQVIDEADGQADHEHGPERIEGKANGNLSQGRNDQAAVSSDRNHISTLSEYMCGD